MKKSFISVLLSCAMVLTSLTVPVFADTVDETVIAEEIAADEMTSDVIYDEIIEAGDIAEDEAAEEVTVDEAAVEEVAVQEEADIAEVAVQEETAEEVGQWQVVVSNDKIAASTNSAYNNKAGDKKYLPSLKLSKTTVTYNPKKKVTIKTKTGLIDRTYVDYGQGYAKIFKKKEYTVSYDFVAVQKDKNGNKVKDLKAVDVITEKKGKFTIAKGLLEAASDNSISITATAHYKLKNQNDEVATTSQVITLATAINPATKVKSIELVPNADGAAKKLETISSNGKSVSANMFKYYTLVVKNADGQTISGDDLKSLKVTISKVAKTTASYNKVNGKEVAIQLDNTGVPAKSIKITVKGLKSKAVLKVKTPLPTLAIEEVTDEDEYEFFTLKEGGTQYLKTTTSCNAWAADKAYIAATDKEEGVRFAVKIKAKGAKLAKYTNWGKGDAGYNLYSYTPTATDAKLTIVPGSVKYDVKNYQYAKVKTVKLKKNDINIDVPSQNSPVKISINSVELKKEVKDAKTAGIFVDGKAWDKAYDKACKAKDLEDTAKKRRLYNGYIAIDAVCIAINEVDACKIDKTTVKFDEVALPTYAWEPKATASTAAKEADAKVEDSTPLIAGSYKGWIYYFNEAGVPIAKSAIKIKVNEAKAAAK